MKDHEAKMIASLLLSPDIIFKTHLRPEQFYDEPMRRIFRAMLDCVKKGIKIDYISVTDVDQSIDKKQIALLPETIPSAANWELYESEIKKDYQRNELSKIGSMMQSIGRTGDPLDFYRENIEKRLLEVLTDQTKTKIQKLGDHIPQAMKDLEERSKLKGQLPGIKSGIGSLDYMTGGFQNGKFIVVGARPSDGKSALTLNMALDAALRQKKKVGLISAESGAKEIILRAIAAEGHVDASRLTIGDILKADLVRAADAAARIFEAPIYVYDTPNIKFGEAKSVAKQMLMTYGIDILFIDYLQIMKWDNQKVPRFEQMSEISVGCKQLARELNIPVVVPAQLKREAQNREPTMADLKETGQIEQDADVLMFIYHPEEEDKNSQIIIAKNRDGPKGRVDVLFRREYVRFHEIERDRK